MSEGGQVKMACGITYLCQSIHIQACIAKTFSKKIRTLIRSMKFPSPKVALYLSKSTL